LTVNMTTGAYIIVLATVNVTAAKNEDPFLMIYGTKDDTSPVAFYLLCAMYFKWSFYNA
jgi:hypothetical protein